MIDPLNPNSKEVLWPGRLPGNLTELVFGGGCPETWLSVTEVRRAGDEPSLSLLYPVGLCSEPVGLGGWGWRSASFYHSLYGEGRGVFKKKVCTPLTRAQPQGQVKSSVTTFPQPAQPGKGSGTDSGVPWGGVLARLSKSCLAVSARAQASEPCWRRWTSGRQVSTPAPAGEVWGWLGGS